MLTLLTVSTLLRGSKVQMLCVAQLQGQVLAQHVLVLLVIICDVVMCVCLIDLPGYNLEKYTLEPLCNASESAGCSGSI